MMMYSIEPFQWLQQFSSWKGQEKYIEQVLREHSLSEDHVKELEAWLRRFSNQKRKLSNLSKK